MVIILRNLSIALLIWCAIWFLHGFFRELYKILREKYEDWQYRKRILQEADKLVNEGLIEWVNRKKGSIRMTEKGMKNYKKNLKI